MLAAFLIVLSIGMSMTSETPFLAYELATEINRADRIEWVRMRDEKNNTRYIINLYDIDRDDDRRIANQLFEKSRQLEAQRAERIKNNMERN